MKTFNKPDKSIILIVVIAVIVIVNIIYITYILYEDTFTKKVKAGEKINTLFLFSDDTGPRFMEVFMYDSKSKKGGIFYIPENVSARIKSTDKFNKISVLYSRNNLGEISAEVSEMLEVDIHFTIDIVLADLVKIIDLLGGLEMFINVPLTGMYKKERILLPAGSVILDGDKARHYLLYSSDSEEEDELVGRKHNFFKALFSKIGNPQTNAYLLHERTFGLFFSYIKTDFSQKALKSFLEEMKYLQVESLAFQRVQGTLKRVEDVEGEIVFPFFKGELMKTSVKQMIEFISSSNIELDNTGKANIEILNGTEAEGLAKRTKILFESNGYHVVSYGNAENNEYEKTIILDRKGNFKLASEVAGLIKCDVNCILSEIQLDNNTDITIILGKDFDGQYVKY